MVDHAKSALCSPDHRTIENIAALTIADQTRSQIEMEPVELVQKAKDQTQDKESVS